MQEDDAVDEVKHIEDIGESGGLDTHGSDRGQLVTGLDLVHGLLELDSLVGKMLQTVRALLCAFMLLSKLKPTQTNGIQCYDYAMLVHTGTGISS